MPEKPLVRNDINLQAFSYSKTYFTIYFVTCSFLYATTKVQYFTILRSTLIIIKTLKLPGVLLILLQAIGALMLQLISITACLA